ncbi:hypothetical protein D9M68_637070 [compost metagenome]
MLGRRHDLRLGQSREDGRQVVQELVPLFLPARSRGPLDAERSLQLVAELVEAIFVVDPGQLHTRHHALDIGIGQRRHKQRKHLVRHGPGRTEFAQAELRGEVVRRDQCDDDFWCLDLLLDVADKIRAAGDAQPFKGRTEDVVAVHVGTELKQIHEGVGKELVLDGVADEDIAAQNLSPEFVSGTAVSRATRRGGNYSCAAGNDARRLGGSGRCRSIRSTPLGGSGKSRTESGLSRRAGQADGQLPRSWKGQAGRRKPLT